MFLTTNTDLQAGSIFRLAHQRFQRTVPDALCFCSNNPYLGSTCLKFSQQPDGHVVAVRISCYNTAVASFDSMNVVCFLLLSQR